MTKEQIQRALHDIGLALQACHNTVATDRPDICSIPSDLSWRIDNSREIKLVQQLVKALRVNSGNDLGCIDRNSSLLTSPASGHQTHD